MGANEISNRMHAAVKVAANGTIVTRTAGVSGVTRTGAGLYEVALVEGIGAESCSYDVGCDANSLPPQQTGYVNARRSTATLFLVHTFDALGAVADLPFCLNIWRVASAAS